MVSEPTTKQRLTLLYGPVNFFFLQFIFVFLKKKKKGRLLPTPPLLDFATTGRRPSTSHLTDRSSTVNQNIRSHPSNVFSQPPVSMDSFTGNSPASSPTIRSRVGFSLLPSSFHLLPTFQAPTSVVLNGVNLWQTLASTGHYLSTAAVIAAEPSLIFHGVLPLPLRCLDLASFDAISLRRAQYCRHMPLQRLHVNPRTSSFCCTVSSVEEENTCLAIGLLLI
jgi:hypothetical protein